MLPTRRSADRPVPDLTEHRLHRFCDTGNKYRKTSLGICGTTVHRSAGSAADVDPMRRSDLTRIDRSGKDLSELVGVATTAKKTEYVAARIVVTLRDRW